ncbi:hypothetical protein ACQF36_29490 [Streptomyces sp. Marseille-Q5077]|uniref:hypothetical protein n=1 Tax=Streptomyces sp. Marseille-Q5077 TaxID=3418995 RepID=UPI003D07F189
MTRPDGQDVPTGCRTGPTSKPSTKPFAARGIPPGSVRQGWFYALIGMSPQDVLLYTVPPTFRTILPTPQDVAEVAEQLVRFRTVPDVEHRTEWDGAAAVRAAARDYRRTVFGLAPVGRQKHEAGTRMESEITEISDPCSVDVWEREGGACVGVDRPSAPDVGWGAVPVGTDPSPEIGTCTARAVDVTPIRPDVVSHPGAIDTWEGEGGALPGVETPRVRAAGERGADEPDAVHPAAPEWAPVPGTNRRTTELTCAGRQYRVYHAPDAVLPYTVRFTLGGAVVDLGGCVGLDDVRAIVRADRRRGAALEAERRRIEQEQRSAAHRLQGERRQDIGTRWRRLPSSRPPTQEMEALPQHHPRQDLLPRRAGHGHPRRVAPPAEAPLQHQPNHRRGEGRSRPSPRLNVRLENAHCLNCPGS